MKSAAPGTRRTFVVQVHAEGPATVENLLTQERVAVSSMSGIAEQIEAWLAKSRDAGSQTKGSGK